MVHGRSEPRRRSRLTVICGVLASLAIGAVSCAQVNPARASVESNRRRLLELTPVGTPERRVRSTIDDEFADSCRWSNLQPLTVHPSEPRYETSSARTGFRRCIGQYWPSGWGGIFTVYVFAAWYFDADGALVEVQVRKDRDVL